MSPNKLIIYGVRSPLLACKSNKNSYANCRNINPVVPAEIDTAYYTTIYWQNSVYNFGTIASSGSVHIKYRLIIAGNTPLFIFNAQTICGCTITSFPKASIMPSKSGFVSITFKSGTQQRKIDRIIRVIANTKGSKSNSLIIRGMVQSPTGQNQ